MNRMWSAALALLLAGAATGADDAAKEMEKKDALSAVRITEALEKDPFRSDADADREWLLGWVTETPDYMVRMCDVMGPIPGDETVPNGRELMLQHMFGNVSWQIRNPGNTDLVALQVAAMESLLKVYSVFVSKDKGARIEYFDGLLEQQRTGRLAQHLAPLVKERCVERTEKADAERTEKPEAAPAGKTSEEKKP
jgi:hypothetical protein